MQKHNLQLEAGFEQESNENTFREDTQLNLIQDYWDIKGQLHNYQGQKAFFHLKISKYGQQA